MTKITLIALSVVLVTILMVACIWIFAGKWWGIAAIGVLVFVGIVVEKGSQN